MSDYTDFFIQKRADISRIKTVEIYNQDFGVLRYVAGFFDKTLGIESGAPRNSGESVVFTALGISWTDPEMTEDVNITTSVSFSRVGTDARSLVKTITDIGAMNGIEVVLREYLSNDLNNPKVFYYLWSESMTINGPDVVVSVSDTNPNIQNTAQVYTIDRFPGLA